MPYQAGMIKLVKRRKVRTPEVIRKHAKHLLREKSKRNDIDLQFPATVKLSRFIEPSILKSKSVRYFKNLEKRRRLVRKQVEEDRDRQRFGKIKSFKNLLFAQHRFQRRRWERHCRSVKKELCDVADDHGITYAMIEHTMREYYCLLQQGRRAISNRLKEALKTGVASAFSARSCYLATPVLPKARWTRAILAMGDGPNMVVDTPRTSRASMPSSPFSESPETFQFSPGPSIDSQATSATSIAESVVSSLKSADFDSQVEELYENDMDVDFDQLLNRVEGGTQKLPERATKDTLQKVLAECRGASVAGKEGSYTAQGLPLDVFKLPDDTKTQAVIEMVEDVLNSRDKKAREYLVSQLLIAKINPQDLFTDDKVGVECKAIMIELDIPRFDNIIVDDRYVAENLNMNVPLPPTIKAGRTKRLVYEIVKDVKVEGCLKAVQKAFTDYTSSLVGKAFNKWKIAFQKGMFDAGLVLKNSPKQNDVIDLVSEAYHSTATTEEDQQFLSEVQVVLGKRYPHCYEHVQLETDAHPTNNFRYI